MIGKPLEVAIQNKEHKFSGEARSVLSAVVEQTGVKGVASHDQIVPPDRELTRLLRSVALMETEIHSEIKSFRDEAINYYNGVAKKEGLENIKWEISFCPKDLFDKIIRAKSSVKVTENGCVAGFFDPQSNIVFVSYDNADNLAMFETMGAIFHEMRHRVAGKKVWLNERGQTESVATGFSKDRISSLMEEIFTVGFCAEHISEIKDPFFQKMALNLDRVLSTYSRYSGDIFNFGQDYDCCGRVYKLLKTKIPNIEELCVKARLGQGIHPLAKEIVGSFGKETLIALATGNMQKIKEIHSLILDKTEQH